MIVTELLAKPGEGLAEERLGFGELALGVEQRGEAAEGCQGVRVIVPQDPAASREGFAEERLGLGVLPLGAEHVGQLVDRDQRVPVLAAESRASGVRGGASRAERRGRRARDS